MQEIMPEQQAKKNKSNKGIAFLIGATAGAVITYFLTTDEGKAWRRETSKRAGEFGQRLSSQAQGKLSQFSDSLDSTIQKGKGYAEEIGTNVKSTFDDLSSNAKSAVEKVENSFQRGMRKAQEEINKRTES